MRVASVQQEEEKVTITDSIDVKAFHPDNQKRKQALIIVILAFLIILLGGGLIILISSSDDDASTPILVQEALTEDESAVFLAASQEIYDQSGDLEWKDMTQYIEYDLKPHIELLRSGEYLTQGQGTIRIKMWDGTMSICNYEGEVNPSGDPHGLGKALDCSYRKSNTEGLFMFGEAHGTQIVNWPDFGLEIYEYRQGE